MVRGGTMYARAARRAAMRAPMLSQANGTHPSDVSRVTCPYCGKEFPTSVGRDFHLSFQQVCRALHEQRVKGKAGQKRQREYEEDSPMTKLMDRQPPTKQVRFDETAVATAGPSRHCDALADPDVTPIPDPISTSATAPNATSSAPRKVARGYTRDGIYVEPYPISTAGAPISTNLKSESDLREYLKSCGTLGDRDLFETAQIMMTTGLNGRGRTRHLNAPAYKYWRKGKEREVWPNNEALLRDVDRLPTGPKWATAPVIVGEGSFKRTHTLYMRNILEVVQELIGARRFRHCMRYAPEYHWTSRDRKHRVYDEMWSGEWWWDMQGQIRNKNGTVVPLILASDEVTCTNNPQGAKAHPIYLSIGNISKAVRRKPTRRSMIVIGYLPVDSFEEVKDKNIRAQYHGELLHRSLNKIFEPLKAASSEGLLTWCADGSLRHIYPIVAAWIADWPEQNDIACTTQSGCPKCMQERDGRGQGLDAPLRNQDEARQTLRGYQLTKNPATLRRLRLRPIAPFWDDFPSIDIGKALVPDLLHQLYNGMYEHVRNWVEDLLGTKEFNRRFMAMPGAQDLRHFNKGVTGVKVWTGRESRDMMRQFLPIVIDAKAPPKFIRLVRSLLDFSYLAHSARLSDTELAKMDSALQAFHDTKSVLLDRNNKALGIVKGEEGFDRIAKLHMLGHYTQDIRQFGTPDGYSTETSEHLHIMYVKIPWRMSNRRNPMPQMVGYTRRLEALEIQRAHIEEYYGEDLEFDVRAIVFEDETYDRQSEDDAEDEGEDDDISDEGALEDPVQITSAHRTESAVVFYPRPKTSIARRPTAPDVPARVIMSSYGAPDFLRALRRFLRTRTTTPDQNLILLPTNRFPLWHKAVLEHLPLPFAPAEPCHRDVVRVRPPVRDLAGRQSKAGIFDTALFATDPSCSGINSYI
ncbi:Zn-finger protein [Ceratobasidium sp. AG-Ba]|nr:Zn-finger protein [Ceratobasidium sp. AG-Ba]